MDIIYRYDPFAKISVHPVTNAEEAIRKLQDGHQRFFNIVTQIQRELIGQPNTKSIIIPSDPLPLGFPRFSGSAPDQVPYALFLGCSDARAPIEHIFDQSSNELFVIRVAGNVLGVECLGSIDFAVSRLGQSLKLLVVLGHSGCGAVTAAVDSYLKPKDYAEIAFTHALRTLVGRIHTAVRGAAHSLENVIGPSAVNQSYFRAALLDVAVYLNAAVTAYDVRRELTGPLADRPRVVFGVFDLISQRVQALPGNPSTGDPLFGDVPDGPEAFSELGARLAEAAIAKATLG